MFSAGNVRAFAVLLLVAFLWPLCPAAQQSAQQPSAPQPPREQSQEPIETLQVNVNVVNVFCNVKDKRGALVPDLKKENFELYEDKKKQTVKYFSAESNQPLTL